MKYWLFNDGILISWLMKYFPFNSVGIHPLYTLNNKDLFHCSCKSMENPPWKRTNVLWNTGPSWKDKYLSNHHFSGPMLPDMFFGCRKVGCILPFLQVEYMCILCTKNSTLVSKHTSWICLGNHAAAKPHFKPPRQTRGKAWTNKLTEWYQWINNILLMEEIPNNHLNVCIYIYISLWMMR